MDIALGSLRALVYRLAGMFFWALIGITTARALSVEDRGTYVSIVAIIGTVGGASPSFSAAAAYFVSNRKRPAAEVATNSVLLAFAVSTLQVLACLAIWAVYRGEGRSLVLIAGLALFPGMARSAITGVFLGTNAMGKYNIATYGQAYAGFFAVVAVVLLLGERSAGGAVAAFIVGTYVSFLALALLQRSWWRWLFRHRPDVRLMKAIVAFGFVTGLAGGVGLLNAQIDRLLVPALDSRQGLGIYSAALALIEMIGLVAWAISIASYAQVGALARREAADLTTRSVRHTLPAVLATAAVVFVFAPVVIRVLFGPRYVEAADSLRVLCVAASISAPVSLLGNYFVVQMGRPSIDLWLGALSFTVKAGLCVLLIPAMGFIGAAWATLVSSAVGATAAVALFLKASGAPANDLWRVRRDDIGSYVRLARRVLRGELFGRAD